MNDLHLQAVNAVAKVRREQRHYPVFTELQAGGGESPDVMYFDYQSGWPCIDEIKTSQADIAVDAKKAFRQSPILGIGANRTLWIPEGCMPHEVHDNWDIYQYRLAPEDGAFEKVQIRESYEPFTHNWKAACMLLAKKLAQTERAGDVGKRLTQDEKREIVEALRFESPIKITVALRMIPEETRSRMGRDAYAQRKALREMVESYEHSDMVGPMVQFRSTQ